MGGGYPKDVWSPAGGWKPDPKYWRRNTAVALAAAVAICVPVFMKSAELEHRPNEPFRWIPSLMWAKQTPGNSKPAP